MIDVNAIIAKALTAERDRVNTVRVEKTTLLSKLMAQRSDLTTAILNLTAELADVDADLSTIDAAATATPANPKP